MAHFKEHKITVKDILGVIPDDLIIKLAEECKVDHYAKTLKGRNVFYLLLYGIIENTKLSQRSLEDTFNDPIFKSLFNLDKSKGIRHSSISERLSNMNSKYFKLLFDNIYDIFSKLYSPKEREKYNISRVDSTIVKDVSGRMKEGIPQCNQSKKEQKNIKISLVFDGFFPSSANVYNKASYGSEDIALPKVIEDNKKEYLGKRTINVIDRGLQSAPNMKSFCDKGIKFICRSKVNRKHNDLGSLITDDTELEFDGLSLISDNKVNLYTSSKNKKSVVCEQEFRLVVIKKQTDNMILSFVTNEYELTPREIAAYYKRRWDIEVFFRFLKQELNTSHLVSLSKNGIEIMLYMTMIISMLILIYKRKNTIGNTTAKRRFSLEVRDLAIATIIELCGGDPKLFFKT